MGTKRSFVEVIHDEGYGDDLLRHLNNALRGKDMIVKRTFEESYKAIREAGGDAYDGVDTEQHLAAIRGQPQGTEARVCDDITERQALGIAKYGKTVEQNDASFREWLQHAYEEALDMAIYLKRAIEKLDGK